MDNSSHNIEKLLVVEGFLMLIYVVIKCFVVLIGLLLVCCVVLFANNSCLKIDWILYLNLRLPILGILLCFRNFE